MKTIQTTVYEYDELSEKAKEKARDWYREASIHDEWWDAVYGDVVECAKLIGIEIAPRNQKWHSTNGRSGIDTLPSIFFSGFSSQGDGACFEGSWYAGRVQPGKLKDATTDTELHRIAAEFESIAKEFPHSGFTVKHSGHYSHKYCTDFSVSITDNEDNDIDTPEAAKAEESLIEAARDFMEWIYRQLEKEYEYQTSDEQVAESIRANEYTFTETGKRF